MDAGRIAHAWLAPFAKSFEAGDAGAALGSFAPDGWLRDALVLTLDSRSLGGHARISDFLSRVLRPGQLSNFALDERPSLGPAPCAIGLTDGAELAFTFETPSALCRGLARLKQDGPNEEWKAASVFLMVDAWKGHEEIGPELGTYEGHTVPWEDVHQKRREDIENDPYVVVVGAGQTGLQIAARFRQMNLPTLIVDKAARVGDQWRIRYPLLSLHTPKTHSTLLYQPFPHTWPTYTPKAKLADWLEFYAVAQDLVIWNSSTVLSDPAPVYDSATHRWTLVVNCAGTQRTIRPAHVVLATGTLGRPYMPSVPGIEAFRGEAVHACRWNGGRGYKDKRVVVVGAANTAADVAQDAYANGAASVTILQRSSTCLVSGEWSRRTFGANFPPDRPIEVSDFKYAGTPWGLIEQVARAEMHMKVDIDAELKAGLNAKGFLTNDGRDGLGRSFLVVERFAGHWIDVGCAQLILDDKIKVRSSCEIARFVEDGVVLSDETELQADAVIFATGYGDVRKLWKETFGDAIIDQAGPAWGLDSENEIQGVYRPTGHPGMWYAAGDFYHSRWMSKQLGLLIQARQLNISP